MKNRLSPLANSKMENTQFFCPGCDDPITEFHSTIFPCKHVLCLPCTNALRRVYTPKCPKCYATANRYEYGTSGSYFAGGGGWKSNL